MGEVRSSSVIKAFVGPLTGPFLLPPASNFRFSPDD
jgi:hypothetical protein